MTLAELQAALKSAIAVRDQLNAVLIEAQAFLDATRRDLSTAQDAVDAARAALDNYEEPNMTRQELVAALSAAQMEYDQQAADVVAAEALLSQYQNDVASMMHQIGELQSQLAALQEDLGFTQQLVTEQSAVILAEQSEADEAMAAVNAAQHALDQWDADHPDEPDPPDPPDPPAPDELFPLAVNGKQWTFRTPPPDHLAIRPTHPRFIIPGREAALQNKLTATAYAKYRNNAKSRSLATYNALLYAITGDAAAGNAAKTSLLAQLPTPQKDNAAGSNINLILMYDWCHDLFTPEERDQAMTIIMARCGLGMPEPGSVEFEQIHHPHAGKGEGFNAWFLNDVHNPAQYYSFLWRGLVALAFHGDGVRDEWCEYAYQAMLHNTDGRFYPVYDAERGGLVDSHNIRALNSSGMQAGYNHDKVLDGYTTYFCEWIVQFMACWETATGDDLFTDNNYFRLLPHQVAYRYHQGVAIGDNLTRQMMLYLTGIYKSIDPQMAGLARWLCSQDSEGAYHDVDVFLLADPAIAPVSPDESMRMSLAKYLDGDDLCHSRSSWSKDATLVQMFSRTLDTHRYEVPTGGLHIVRKGVPLIMRGNGRKGSMRSAWVANIMAWRTGKHPDEWGFGEITWGGAQLRGPHATKPLVNPPTSPYVVATTPSYWCGAPTENRGTKHYHVFGVDSSALRTDSQIERLDVQQCKRTIVHLRPDPEGREFIVIYDRVRVGVGVSHCWAARFRNQPIVNGNQWTAENAGQQIVGTSLIDDTAVTVAGGKPNCTEGPTGAVPSVIDKLFYADGSQGHIFGDYAIYLKPSSMALEQDYCVVFEVGDAGFEPAVATIDDGVVSVAGRMIDFTREDQTLVV